MHLERLTLSLIICAALLALPGCDEGGVSGDGGNVADGAPGKKDGPGSKKDGAGSIKDGPGSKKDGPVKPPSKCTPSCPAGKFCSKAGVCLSTGQCAHHDDCPKGYVCDFGTKKCVPTNNCGSMKLVADVVAPNLLIDLDRSCSMKSKVKGTTKNKWQIAVDAMKKVMATNKGKIRFGLTLFPDTVKPACTQSQFAVPVGPGNEAKISALLTAALVKKDPNFPDGPCVTNIDTAMKQAADHKPLADKTRDNFVVLITDGAQYGCSSAGSNKGTLAIITALALKKVPTFVVGFGSGVSVKWLNAFAIAGGKALAHPTVKYYKAENQTTLDAALTAIAKATMGCVYKLKKVPPTMNKIFVFFDKKSVPKDTTHKNGWDYDQKTNAVTFYGVSCSMLKAGKVKDLDIVYGCNKPSSDGGPGPTKDGGPAKDGGPYTEAGQPKCKPGVTPCKTSADCPVANKYKCVKGCCEKIIS